MAIRDYGETHTMNGTTQDDNTAFDVKTDENVMVDRSGQKPHLDDRIERIEELLGRLKQEREQLESDTPPPRGREMKDHIANLANRIGLTEDDIIYRTREINGEDQRVPTGFNKDGVVQINKALYEAEQEIEELRNKLRGDN